MRTGNQIKVEIETNSALTKSGKSKTLQRLMAAAPEMLEALYEARSALEKKGWAYENEQSWNLIEAAISKAEGDEKFKEKLRGKK